MVTKLTLRFQSNEEQRCLRGKIAADMNKYYVSEILFSSEHSYLLNQDHFESHQFEKPRQDGRKKLKDCAVPTFRSIVPIAVRKPLGDLSNSLNIVRPSIPKQFKSVSCTSHNVRIQQVFHAHSSHN